MLRTCWIALLLLVPTAAQAFQAPVGLKITVNSNQDGPPSPDGNLTLREAIALTNGTLTLTQLSSTEKTLVTPIQGPSRIEFKLPPDQTTLQLQSSLPPLANPGLVVDGTTQQGYNPKVTSPEIPVPTPIVAITPAPGVEISRGLTIVADRVAVRGLSLYGFTTTTNTPYPADIFITHAAVPPEIAPELLLLGSSPITPPRDVQIEGNWLGVPPGDPILSLLSGSNPVAEGTLQSPLPEINPIPGGAAPSLLPANPIVEKAFPGRRSAFGVSIFDGRNTLIRQNLIANHTASAIITSIRAEQLRVTENSLIGNGTGGLPDAIRLEGMVNQTEVSKNVIVGNAGSGIYLFKPEGTVQIIANQIRSNGRRFRRAAIYLMGDDHQVRDNEISEQPGPGITVAAYPTSRRNIIRGNRFRALEGLSIDLVSQNNANVQNYQQGDGPNPRANSPNRRLDTGNLGISAPQFFSPEFLLLGDRVGIDGIADPGSQVDLYRVGEDQVSNRRAWMEPLATVTADEKGRFSFTRTDLKPGDRISAIATDPRYGTSEPSSMAVIQSLKLPPVKLPGGPQS